MKKVCVVTGSRAEYGLLRLVMREIKDSPNLNLQIIATGMHLSPEFGLTYTEIEKDGFTIDKKVEMLLNSDTSKGVATSMGLGMIGCANALEDLKPDLILILGDRFEIFSLVSTAMIFRIPVAHLHGGELTEGLIDESIRHSITKMSHLHFVATKEYRDRVIQLGENPKNVFQVGGLGIDNIFKMKLLNRSQLEDSLDFKLAEKNLLITYHPVTLEKENSEDQLKNLLSALEELKDTNIIFTMPNADMDSRILFKLIKEFVNRNSKFANYYTSLGQLKYLSCLKHIDAVIGNSSSGLIEAPSFKKGTINIGNRQKGRIKAESVIDCIPEKESILKAINKIYSKEFQIKLKSVSNPYGNGGASDKIIKILNKKSFDNITKKKFYNIKIL